MDKDWVEAVVLRNDHDNRIAKILSVDFEDAIPKGENYFGAIVRAKLTVILGSGRKTVKTVIIKQETEEMKTEELKEESMFKIETMVYKDVFPQLEVLMDEYGDNRETLWCRMLAYKAYNMIIMEDIKAENYKVADRLKCLDEKHGCLVMRSLARYHAMSSILFQRGIINKNDFRPFYVTQKTLFTTNMFRGGLKVLSSVILSSWAPEWRPLGEKIRKEADVVCDKLTALAETSKDTLFVVGQGDLWTCNIMFKYSQDNTPIAVKFVDFQKAHANSYIFDIIYFLYTSIIPTLRREKLDLFIRAYQESLSHTLEMYEYRGHIPTFEDVKAELKRTEYYAFANLATIHAIVTADVSNPYNPDLLDPENDEVAFNQEIFRTDKYISNTCKDFKRFMDEGVI